MTDREHSTRAPASDPRRPRVVLADDHPDVRLAFARMLQTACDVVASVANGAQAIQAVTDLRPEILVVDLMMPDMDGLEVCRTVRAMAPDTAVIIVTAFDDAQVRKIAMRDGAKDFVPKAQASDLLENAIRRLTSK
jgi:CheY-like chemotaxis protein